MVWRLEVIAIPPLEDLLQEELLTMLCRKDPPITSKCFSGLF